MTRLTFYRCLWSRIRISTSRPTALLLSRRVSKPTSVLGELADSQAMVHTGTSPMVIAPAGINTDSGAGFDPNSSVWEEDDAAATDTFPAVLTNPPYLQDSIPRTIFTSTIMAYAVERSLRRWLFPLGWFIRRRKRFTSKR